MGLPKIMANIYTFVFHTVRYGFNTMFTLLDFSVNERAPRGLAVLTLGTTKVEVVHMRPTSRDGRDNAEIGNFSVI